MERSPFSLPRRIAGARVAAAAVSLAMLGATLLAGPAGAQTSRQPSARALPQVAPLAACPSASSVSAIAGFSVPSPTSNTYSNTGTSAQFGTLTTKGTLCSYIGSISMTTGFKEAIVMFAHLSKSISVGNVEAYMKTQLQKQTSKMPPGMSFNWKLGTQFGLPTVWLHGSATIETFHIVFNAAFSYRSEKVAGAELVGGSQAKANALEKLAINAYGM